MIGGVRRVLNGTARVSPVRAGKLGYRLLARPRRPALEPAAQAFLARAVTQKIQLGGIDTQTYHWPGPGPTVLLLHGWESCTGRWQEYYQDLTAAGFDLRAFDAPAHGRSGGDNFTVIEYARVLDDYLHRLHRAPDFWLGHSAGGMAIMYYLTQHENPLRPRRVVTMSVPAELTDFLAKFQSVLGLNDEVVAGIEQEFIRRMRVTFSDVSPARYAAEIDVPGLILHDVDDDLAPVAGAEAMFRNWPVASLMLTQGLGHSMLGEEVVQLAVDYLLLEDEEIVGQMTPTNRSRRSDTNHASDKPLR